MRLLKSRILTGTLRRSAWTRWLAPIDSASPSPLTIHTERSSRAAARPVAMVGGGAPVDGVHPVGVHVVGEAPGAADAGDEDDLLGRDAELGHEALDGSEHRVVAAARAPARLLVGLEVGLGQRQRGCGGHGSLSRMAFSISAANSGRPSTRE